MEEIHEVCSTEHEQATGKQTTLTLPGKMESLKTKTLLVRSIYMYGN